MCFREIRPDYMVMTNLFRDQLDRYGEIDITMNILEEMMKKVPDMKVIVNGDDALSAYLAMDCGNPFVTLRDQQTGDREQNKRDP